MIALVPNNSLITETPEEGRQLAVKLARLIIKLMKRSANSYEMSMVTMP